jgi:Zn-dependent peptidase ImmA (M78 family)
MNKNNKIPKTITIMHHIYNVELVSAKKLEKVMGYNAVGATLYRKSQILILDELSDSQKKTTLMHEVLHACMETGGAVNGTRPSKKAPSTEWEHHYIYSLQNIMIDLMKNNPRLISYLTT